MARSPIHRTAAGLFLAFGFALAAGAAIAADPAPRAAAVQAVVDCRKIDESTERLACYDKAAADIAAAEDKGDLISLDRTQRQSMRRAAFGLALPSFAVLDKGERPEDLNQLKGVVATAQQDGFGRWVVKLEDGAIWRQTDDTALSRSPRAGSPVVIIRGLMNSYMMKIDGQPSIRVHRTN